MLRCGAASWVSAFEGEGTYKTDEVLSAVPNTTDEDRELATVAGLVCGRRWRRAISVVWWGKSDGN